jgi:hypothetical protein
VFVAKDATSAGLEGQRMPAADTPASPLRFSAPVQRADGPGSWVEVPAALAATLPQKRAPVVATVNGHPYRTRIAVYGGRSYLGLRADLRAAAGIELGDVLDVELAIDTEPRVVDEPDELRTALDGSGTARARYDALPFTHRREYAGWVGSAKRPETRVRRAARAVEMLLAGVKTPG